MKHRFIILLLSATTTLFSVQSQHRLVEQVRKDIAVQSIGVDDLKKAKSKLKPALEHTETFDKAGTWWLATLIDIGIYDKSMSTRSLGKKVDGKEMGHALLDAYDDASRTLRLDTIYLRDNEGHIRLNKNGTPKYKTKYSPKALRLLYDHLVDFSAAGGELFMANDYEGAYKAWDIYCSLSRDIHAKDYKVNEPDSLVGYFRYYQGLAAYQIGNYENADKLYDEAETLGYRTKRMYDSWIDDVLKLNDTTRLVAIATKAHALFGIGNSRYLRILINDCLNKKQYTKAASLINEALENEPHNAEYFDLMGQIVERLNNISDALPFYRRAVELDPNYALGQFNLGNAIYRMTILQDNRSVTDSIEQYREALIHIENAYKLGLQDEPIRLVLSRLYYLLGSDKIETL